MVVGQKGLTRHVDSHRRKQPNDDIKASQSAVGSVHIRGRKFHMSGNKWSTLLCCVSMGCEAGLRYLHPW